MRTLKPPYAKAHRAALQSLSAGLRGWLGLLRRYTATGTAFICMMAMAAVLIGADVPASGGVRATGLGEVGLQSRMSDNAAPCGTCASVEDRIQLKLPTALADVGGG